MSYLFRRAHFLVRQVKQVVRGVDRRERFKEFKLVPTSLLAPPTSSHPLILVVRRSAPFVIGIITSTTTVRVGTARSTENKFSQKDCII